MERLCDRNVAALTMALLILAVIVFLGTVSAASTPVSVQDGDDATFTWPLPAAARDKPMRVVSPEGQPVLDWGPGCTVTPSPVYSHRVRASCQDASHVTFTLLGVTWSDEGFYACRDVTSSDLRIEDCGQNLTLVKVSPQVHIELTTSDIDATETERKHLTLICEFTKAAPPVPEDGYSWSYRPSPQGQLRPLMGKTRTLGPLTKEDSGQYVCQARNDQNTRGNILPGIASIDLNTSCIEAFLQSDVFPQAVVEKDGDGYKAVFELAQYPGLILVLHPNTFHITDWHSPCNFGVTGAFKDRVIDTSCNLCKRTLSFSLSNLTERDLGRYQCYDGTTLGAKLERCSVELISNVPILAHMEPVTSDHVVKGAEGSHLTLTCVVIQALPPVPEDGYSWSYLPSPQAQLRPLVGKTRTLTLGPLTPEDRGQYFCQASNALTTGGKISPGMASVSVDVLSGASDGRLQETIVALLVVILVVVVTIAVGFFVYRWHRRRRKSSKNSVGDDPDEITMESQETTRKRPVSLSQESNSEARTRTQEIAAEAGIKVEELDNEDETSPLIERQARKRPASPTQESNSEARTEETAEAGAMHANLVDEDETDPAIDLKTRKRPPSPSQESNSETRTEETVEAGGTGANLTDEDETDPPIDLSSTKQPVSPSEESKSEARTRTEETVEAEGTGANLVDEERNGRVAPLKSMKESPSPSQECNSEARTPQTAEAGGTAASLDFVVKTGLVVDLKCKRPFARSHSAPAPGNLDDEGRTDPVVDARKRPPSPTQESNSEARTEETAEAGGTATTLVEEERNGPVVDLKSMKRPPSPSQESSSEARTEETVEAGGTGANMADEEEIGPAVDLNCKRPSVRPPAPAPAPPAPAPASTHLDVERKTDPEVDRKSRKRPPSPSQKSNSQARTEQTVEAGDTSANLADEEETDPAVDLNYSKEPSTQSQKSTCLTTPKGDKSSKVDLMHRKSCEAEHDPLLAGIVDNG